jgi:K+-sensing histidine kinase KdpD
VFFYLLPISLLTMAYGRLAALLCAAGAMLCSAFFLYDPIYSFEVANRLEVGDLVCFAVLYQSSGGLTLSGFPNHL